MIIDTETTVPESLLTDRLPDLQSQLEASQAILSSFESEREKKGLTLIENLKNRAQLDGSGVELAENNLNLVIIAVVFYYLFKG